MKPFLQIVGVALVVVGGQGAIRLLFNHSNTGLFGWLSPSFAALLIINVLLVIAGAILASWASKKA